VVKDVGLGLITADAARDVYGQEGIPDAATLRREAMRAHVNAVRASRHT
jgi:ribosomal protein S5